MSYTDDFTYTYAVTVDAMYRHWIRERYEEERDGDDSEYCEVFDSLDDARKAFDAKVAELSGWYNIVVPKRGLETVEFKSVGLDRFKRFDDGLEDFDENVDGYCSLPDKVADAMDKAKRSAWDYYDWKEDDHCFVRDFLD